MKEIRKHNGKLVIKNNFMVVVNYLILIALFLRGISAIDINQLEFIDFINVLSVVFLVIIIIKSLIQPYIIITDGQLTIYRVYFMKKTISLSKIKSIEFNEMPFSSSYILLVNGGEIKFNPFAIGKKDKILLQDKLSDLHPASPSMRNG